MKYFIEQKNNFAIIIEQHDNLIRSFTDQDPANSDYQKYLAWVDEGNTAEEWDNS